MGVVILQGGRANGQRVDLPYLAPRIERPLQYRHGILIEQYHLTGVLKDVSIAEYVGLRRLDALPIRFDPTRLPQ